MYKNIHYRHYRRKLQRGFIHVLLLVFAILGLTLWGASEIQQWAVESKRTVTKKSEESLTSAKDALLNYALLPPEAIQYNNTANRYNMFNDLSGVSDAVPFRYFSLPCPDVALGTDGDSNLDGTSDYPLGTPGSPGPPVVPATSRSCGTDDIHTVLQSGSRFGRLPWRDDKTITSGEFSYVRGLGSIDFRDGYNQRLWYAVSRNVIDNELPLNPHYLLRLTTGWLSAYDGGGGLLSERVAAVVIAPGLYGAGDTGARIAEASLYYEGTTVTAAVAAALVTSYLNPLSYAGFNASVEAVTIINDAEAAGSDKIDYLTIDELAADGGAGITVLENAGQNIYDAAAGEGDILGISELMEQHLNRYGFLPEPAVFDAVVVTQRSRPNGAPGQTTIGVSYSYETPSVSVEIIPHPTDPITNPPTMMNHNVTATVTVSGNVPLQQGARMDATGPIPVAVRIADLPPVYLAAGSRINAYRQSDPLPPPYGAALARLDTAVNRFIPDALEVDRLDSPGTVALRHRPQGLGGLQSDALIDAELENLPQPPIPVVQGELVTVAANSGYTVILAENAYGYFIGETLITIMSYPGVTGTMNTDIAALPPAAVKALLPAGTRLNIGDSISDSVSLQLPADYELPTGSVFDSTELRWHVVNDTKVPLKLVADADLWLTVTALPNDFPLVAGDVGLLPAEAAIVRDDREGMTVVLSDSANAISRLAAATRFHVGSDILLVPFPPPGLPSTVAVSPQALMTPYNLTAGGQFTAPAGSRIIYPLGASITTGDSFGFPPNSVLQLKAGAVVEVQAYPDAVLPGGAALGNAAATVVMATLVHGGFVNIADARVDFSSSDGFLSAEQKLFDIELRGAATVMSGPTLSANEIIRPFIHRRLVPPAVVTVNNGVFFSDSYVRAGFLTRPRYFRFPDVDSTRVLSSDDNAAVTLSNMRGLYSVTLAAALSLAGGAANPDIEMVFDEDTQFFIPPKQRLSIDLQYMLNNLWDRNIDLTLARNVILPPGTGIFDADMMPQHSDLVIDAASPFHPDLIVTSEPLVLNLVDIHRNVVFRRPDASYTANPIFENRLALYPETDMYVEVGGNVSVIAAGSIVDVTRGEIHSPVGLQRIRRVADDLSIKSAGVTHIYNYYPVTLLVLATAYSVDNSGGGAVNVYEQNPQHTVYARYVSFNDYADMAGAAAPVEGLLTLVRQIILPAGSYIQLPPGRDIDILSDSVGSVDQFPYADHSHLPPGAVAVIPANTAMTAHHQMVDTVTGVTSTVLFSVDGPAYINLHDGRGRMAYSNSRGNIALGRHLRGSPLIFLSDVAHLNDFSTSVKVTLHTNIPETARLDMHGFMEQRVDSGFYTDLMPADSRQFFEDFPLVYAVAPQCRRGMTIPGADCAEGDGEGLEFELQAGEEYILREPLELPAAALITSAYPGVELAIDVMNIGSTAVINSYTGIDAILVDSGGEVEISPVGIYTPGLNEKIIVRVDGNNYHTELRTYVDFAIVATTPLDDITYVATEGNLTIYSGGYVGDNYAGASGGATITLDSTFAYGYGAELNSVTAGDRVFGAESTAMVDFDGTTPYSATINLGEYVYSGSGDYAVSVTLSADAYDVDFKGALYLTAGVNSRVAAHNNSRLDIDQLVERVGESRLITVAPTANIPMETGYLWQGYVPLRSQWHVGRNILLASPYVKTIDNYESAINPAQPPVPMVFTTPPNPGQTDFTAEDFPAIPGSSPPLPRTTGRGEPATITTALFPDNQLHLRIQPTVTMLNLWGSGLELPESIDSNSFTHIQGIEDSMGNVEPYYSYGAGRHVFTQSRLRKFNDWFLGRDAAQIPHRLDGYLQRPTENDYYPTLSFVFGNAPRNLAQHGIAFNTVAVRAFAELIDGTKLRDIADAEAELAAAQARLDLSPTGPGLLAQRNAASVAVDTANTAVAQLRNVDRISLRIAVRNTVTGETSLTVAHWRPVVVGERKERMDDGMGGTMTITTTRQITGVVRVNNQNSSPLLDSRSETDRWVTYFYDESRDAPNTGGVEADAASYLLFEWLGRSARTMIQLDPGDPVTMQDIPEDGFINNFMCGSTPARAVFNIPQTDITGTGVQHRIWPSAQRNTAYINNFIARNQGTPVVNNGNLYDAFTPAARAAYSPETARLFAQNAPVAPAVDMTDIHTSAEVAAGDRPGLQSFTDWVFYMDRAYYSTEDLVYSTLPRQTLFFGNNFSISGPAAIVPPFGGNREASTRVVYGERSRIMNAMFGYRPLPLLYDEISDCRIVGSDDCQALYNNPYWFPVTGGAITFDGLEVGFGAPAGYDGANDVRLVLPQPQAEVTDVGGTVETIYAGSIIYPRQMLVQAAEKIPAGYRLLSDGEVVAHVDVSPVRREINNVVRHRKAQAFDGGVFNYAPAPAVEASDPTAGTDCIVEPLGFAAPGPHFDLDLRAVSTQRSATADPVPLLPQRAVDTTSGRDNAELDRAPGPYKLNSQLCRFYEGNRNIMGCWRFIGGETPVAWPIYHNITPDGVIIDRPGSSSDVERVVDRDYKFFFNTSNPFWMQYGVFHRENNFNAYNWVNWDLPPNEVAGALPGNTVDLPNQLPGGAGRAYTFEPIRYDGSFNRGHLANDVGINLLTTYFSGAPLFAVTNAVNVSIYEPHGINVTVSLVTGTPINVVVTRNEMDREFTTRMVPVIDPNTGMQEVDAMGELVFMEETVVTDIVNTVDRMIIITPGMTTTVTEVTAVANLPSRNTDSRLGNPLSYHWQVAGTHFLPIGMENISLQVTVTVISGFSVTLAIGNEYSYTSVGVNIDTTGDEFDSLRLAHRINIHPDSAATMALKEYSPQRYPRTADDFFTFPDNTFVTVVNNDLGSWVSAHPHIGLYQQGLAMTLINPADPAMAEMTVAADNDAYRIINVSGKHVVHYQRSESSEHREPLSGVPIHTNVWLSLPQGGRLLNDATGDTIELPPDSMLNPVFGTYLAARAEEPGFGSADLVNEYQAQAQAYTDIQIVRPALVFPAGARLMTGAKGGVIRNVKAAALFSLTPLESIQCPTGVFNASLDTAATAGQTGAPVVLSQLREGIYETNYEDATSGREFSFGHPCAWLDDPENMDGDRFYIYRGRRRYSDEAIQLRPTSNDRTYLLGGRLELNA